MCKRHHHADVIIAWAEGKTVQFRSGITWIDVQTESPSFNTALQYRIKPEPSDLEKYGVEVGDVWFTLGGYTFTVSCANAGSNCYRTTTGALCGKSNLKTLVFRRGVVNKL